MGQKVRMADIAQRLGISIVSVSKALAGKDGVSEEMRARVVALAAEMGYVAPGQSRADTAPGNIGILVADRFFDDSTFYSALYREVLMRCTASGYSALLEIVSPEREANCQMPAMIVGHKVEGLIFMGEINRAYFQAAVQAGLPFMLLDFYDDELAADCVISDGVAGGYRLTRHLLEQGRADIGFVGSIFATSSIMDRYLGYTKAMLRAGHPPRAEWRLEDRNAEGRFIPLQLPQVLPQAFVCSCDEVAFNLVEALKRRGCGIPGDVAVVGYDDYRFAQLCDPPLTTYRVNVEEMATAVVSQLIRKMRGKRIVAGSIVIAGQLVTRRST